MALLNIVAILSSKLAEFLEKRKLKKLEKARSRQVSPLKNTEEVVFEVKEFNGDELLEERKEP